jgi:hypothetical protein
MLRKKCLLTLLTLFGVSLFYSATAGAARRDGLANSELIEDKDDVFTYPQLVVDYDNMISFEYGAGAQTGNVLGLFGGDSWGMGIAVHRGDVFEMNGIGNVPGGAGAVTNLQPNQLDLVLSRSFPYANPDTSANQNPTTPVQPNGTLNFQPEPAHTLFDLMGGYDLGNGKVGARLSLGVGGTSVNPAPDDQDRSNEGQLYFLFKGGYSGTFGDLSVDTGLSILSNSADDNNITAMDPDDAAKGSLFGIALDGRVKNEFTETVALGGLFDVGYSSLNVTEDGNDDEPKATTNSFAIQAGVGPVFTIGGDKEKAESAQKQGNAKYAQFDEETTGETTTDETTEEEESGMATGESSGTATDATAPTTEPSPTTQPTTTSTTTTRSQSTAPAQPAGEKDADKKDNFKQSATVAAYAVFGHNSLSVEPNDDQDNDQFGLHSTMVPGLHLAGEFHILEWLYFRSGAQYFFQRAQANQEVMDEDANQKNGLDSSGFGWSAGVGVEVGQFTFDGSLNRSFLRAGPNFISGSSNNLFGTASAKFKW